MAVIKANVQDQFTHIPNYIAQSTVLSVEAKGLILAMSSRPVDWKFNKTQLMSETGMGRDKLKRIFNELINHGFLSVSQKYDEQGRFKENDYYFFTDPRQNPAFIPLTEKPSTVEPSTVNQPLQRKSNTKKDNTNIEQTNLLELGFENFWQNWHNKKDKKKARKAFEKVTKESLNKSDDEFKCLVEKITMYAVDRMRHIETQKELNSFYFDDGFPNLHPTTYLNNSRWEDEYK